MLAVDVPPYRLTGTVYAVLLNHVDEVSTLRERALQPPYKALPVGPVLALRPRNTLAADGAAVALPEAAEVEVGASLAIVIGRTACRVPAEGALAFVAGYTVAADLQLPHESHYRPAVRFKARDGFCVVGSRVLPASAVPDPDALAVRVSLDGRRVQQASTGGRVRNVARSIADVTDFMTLQAGDILLLGAAPGSPRARAGQHAVVEIEGLCRVGLHLVREGVAA